MLITAGEHYGAVLNAQFDYIRYLDEIARYGFNLTRVFSGTYRELDDTFAIKGNTLAPKAGQFLSPWARTETPGAVDGGTKFDLTRWNQAYFDRLKDFVTEAGRRGIVVEMVLFCVMYNDGVWTASPLNARNNVNGIGDVGRGEIYNAKDRALLKAQQELVRKLVTELNQFDNVYFEICNEPYERGGLTKVWNDAIIETIVTVERALPRKHLIAQGFPRVTTPVAGLNPHVSILNFHAAKPEIARANQNLARVLAFDETGGSDQSDRKYRTEGWDWIISGGAVYDHLDFSFATDRPDGSAVPLPPGTPGGGGPELRRQLQVLKQFIESFEFARMQPADAFAQPMRIAGSNATTTVRTLADHGRAYAVYLNGGDQAELALQLPPGAYKAEWLNTRTGRVEADQTFEHVAGSRKLTSPKYTEDIALRVRRAGRK